MKQAFSLLELVFVLVIIAIIGGYAVPKYMDTKDAAVVTTIKRDITTISTSIQTHFLINGKLDKIEDAIVLNTKYWTIENNKVIFKDQSSNCVIISFENSSNLLKVDINESAGNICKKLKEAGVENNSITLY